MHDDTFALFSYAVLRERHGDTKLFNAILRLKTRRLDQWGRDPFTWLLVAPEILINASPRALVLAGPPTNLEREISDADAEDLVSKWVEAISEVSRTERVAGSVVDVLLQIAANPYLLPFIPADLWLWLNKRPSLPPVCGGLLSGCDYGIVRTVRGLKDIGVLTSYLILIWSEWKLLFRYQEGFREMRRSVREDFKGIEMSCHRAELIQRLDYILGEMDRLSQRSGVLPKDEKLWRKQIGVHSEALKDVYGELKRILQEVDEEATEIPNRMPHSFIFLSLLTLMDLHRIPLDLHVCPASPMSINPQLERLARFPANYFIHPQYYFSP